MTSDDSATAIDCPHDEIRAEYHQRAFTGTTVKIGELQVFCLKCGAPAQFLGIPIGMMFTQPATNAESTALYIPTKFQPDKLIWPDDTPTGIFLNFPTEGSA